jgi:hypothetical protein
MRAQTALPQNGAKQFIGMIQLAFDFETITPVRDVIAVVAPEKTYVAAAEPEIIKAGLVEEASVTVPDAIAVTPDLIAQPVQEFSYVVVELWDELVSPCRKCNRVGGSKKNCSRNCAELSRFQEQLKNVVTYGASDPEGGEVEFGYI